jgi:hypothetical protein
MIREATKILFVLEQFKLMGATREELLDEMRRLQTDDEYYITWCVNLSWCSYIPIDFHN